MSLINKEDYILPDCLQNFSFSTEELEEMNKDAEKIAKTLGWQNGNGLNNPTFRVFLK